jgi:CheY-like chemotaxis protein
MSNADAMNYLIGGKMILFDEQIVDAFLEIMVPYPTGIEVRLSSREVGQVIGQTSNNKRPLIYLAAKQQIVNLATSSSYQNITVLNDVEYENTANEAISASTSAVNSFPAHSGSKKKIMIVDDVFVSIAYTKLALGDEYDIVTCLGGSKAAAMAVAEKPDLILMDYEMPDLNGAAAVNEIHQFGLHMPIIFLTGKCDKETVHACSHCGAADYILKPANPVYLRTRVAMALLNIDGNTFL